jgi:hypothetical protein
MFARAMFLLRRREHFEEGSAMYIADDYGGRAIPPTSPSSTPASTPSSAAPAAENSGSGSSSSTPPLVSNEAAAAVESGDAQQVQNYVEQHPDEAQAVYQELLLTDPGLLYQIERNTNGANPSVILAQYKTPPPSGAPGSGGPDLSAQMAEVTGKERPDEEVTALSEAAQDIEAQYGSTVATGFVADYVRSNPQVFAEGVLIAEQYGGGVAPESRQMFANALSQAYDSTPTTPYGYSSPYGFAKNLIDGTFTGQEGYARSTMSELVAMSGNDKLQADFVTAGLYRGNFEIVTDPSSHFGAARGRAMIESLAPATAGSRDAAQAVIRFAENNRIGDTKDELQNEGVDSLRWILETLKGYTVTNSSGDYQSGYITYLEAAMYGSGAASLGTRESAELFLAISGASTEGTGLLEVDGPGGRSNPRATQLTSELFQTYFDRWMASPELGLTVGGNILDVGAAGTPFEGVEINKAFRNFFGEALLDSNEAGDYRDKLLSFVTTKVFEGMDPDSALSKALGPDSAAQLSGNLVGQLEGAQVDLSKIFAADAESQKRLYSLLLVVSLAAGGAGVGTTLTAASAKVILAAIAATAGTGGNIGVQELVARGVDQRTAEVIAGYANGDRTMADVFKDSAVFRQFEAAGLSEAKVQDFERMLSSSISNPDKTLAEVLTDGIAILDNETSGATRTRFRNFFSQFNQGLEYQRRENAK